MKVRKRGRGWGGKDRSTSSTLSINIENISLNVAENISLFPGPVRLRRRRSEDSGWLHWGNQGEPNLQVTRQYSYIYFSSRHPKPHERPPTRGISCLSLVLYGMSQDLKQNLQPFTPCLLGALGTTRRLWRWSMIQRAPATGRMIMIITMMMIMMVIFSDLLDLFWNNHDPTIMCSRQVN